MNGQSIKVNDPKEMIKAIKKSGKVQIFSSVLDGHINVEKGDLLRLIEGTEDQYYLIIWPDGNKAIERKL